MQFTSWPDYGVPLSATAMLEFLQRMRDMQSTLVTAMGDTWTCHPLGPPIVVHCSAGIGRTGIIFAAPRYISVYINIYISLYIMSFEK